MAEPKSLPETFSLEDQIRTVKAEIDALQIDALAKSVPWYGNASTLIAAFALMISLGSTIFTYVRNIDQDNWALRTELRSLILRLNDLPLKNYELQQKYKDTQLIAGDLAGFTNNENLIVATQAAEIITKIPAMVSGGEAMSVAVALRNSNQLKSSTDLLLVALEGRNNSESMVTILRNLGRNYFIEGNLEEGRKYFKNALDLFSRGQFKSSTAIYELSTQALTEMFWAQQEAFVKKCDAWKEHIGRAYVHIEKAISLTPELTDISNPIKGQIDETASYGCNS